MKTARLQLVNKVFALMPLGRGFRVRAALLSWAGIEIDLTARVMASVRILSTSVSIGRSTYIGHETMVVGGESGRIEIGEYVDIAPRVTILGGTHNIDITAVRRAGEGVACNTSVGSGCWIGACSVILPGVTIGRSCVVGAGSVVVNDLPDNCLAVGNPCKPIRDLSSTDSRHLLG